MHLLGTISDLEKAFVFSFPPDAHKQTVTKARRLYDKHDFERYDFNTKSTHYYIDLNAEQTAEE